MAGINTRRFGEGHLTSEPCEHTRISLAGVPVSASDLQGSLARLDSLINDGNHHYVCFFEGNLFSQINRRPNLREVLCRSSMVLPDGVVLMLLARLLRIPLHERVPGPRFLPAACEYGLKKGYRHFFYGGAPGVAERLGDVFSRRYPGLNVVGVYNPPFRLSTGEEEREIKAMIERARPHLLWVGLGGPKQEFWMAEHVGRIDVPVMLGVGAAFDFHSCTVPWAPSWMRAIGMEWVYRAVTGGKRVFWRNVRCVLLSTLLVAQEVWREVITTNKKGTKNRRANRVEIPGQRASIVGQGLTEASSCHASERGRQGS